MVDHLGRAVAISLAAVVLANSTAVVVEAQQTVSSSTLPGKNLFGQDYRSFATGRVFQCRDACLTEEQCAAWTFVKPGIQGESAVCWLKDGTPAESSDACCTSGVKLAAQQESSGTPVTADAAQKKEVLGDRADVTVNGVRAIAIRKVASRGGPAGPTASFSELDAKITVEAENFSQSYRRAEFDIRAVDAPGYTTGASIYDRRPGFGLSPGQAGTATLGMGDSLSPGRFRLVIIVGESESSIPIAVTTEHPLAQILTPTDEAELGPNIALGALGGSVATSSNWDGYDIADELIDGVPWIRSPENTRECVKCGWASRLGDATPTITLDLAGDRPASIASVVVDVRKFKPEWTNWNPENLRISVSETGNESDFRALTTARLSQLRERQIIELPETVRASAVKLEVLSNFGGDPGAGINEIEVREALEATPSVLEDVEIDLAKPTLGGSLVRYSGYLDEWSAAKMFDDHPHSWVSYDRYFPQDFTLAFNRDRLAQVDRVEIVLEDRTDLADTWPSEVAIAVSEDHPIDGFAEVVRMPIERRAGVHEIPVGRVARYLKVRVLDNHGADHTTIAELRVIEARDSQSVLGGEADSDSQSSSAPGDQGPSGELTEVEPNDTIDEANSLVFDQTVAGKIDPLGEEDFFALPGFDPEASALTLAFNGRPYIRHGLSLLDEAGEVLSHFDPGDLPAADAHLSFKLTGAESHLRLSEPPASVVVIWDTSGSMQGSEDDLERAVRQYVRLAPESQEIGLIRFSDRVETLGGFSADKTQLARRLNGKFVPDGGTSLYDAVLRGLQMLENRAGNRAIVLMTDGNDNSRTWLGDVWSELERNRIRLYTIGLGGGLQEYSYVLASTGEQLLGHLAAGTNGRSFFATDSSALRDFYSQIAEELAEPATYLLTPTQEIGEGLLQVVAIGEQVPSAAMPAVHVIFDVSGSMSEALRPAVARIDCSQGSDVQHTGRACRMERRSG